MMILPLVQRKGKRKLIMDQAKIREFAKFQVQNWPSIPTNKLESLLKNFELTKVMVTHSLN